MKYIHQYVVFVVDGKKDWGLVRGETDDVLTGTSEKNRHLEPVSFKIETRDVIAVLPKKPEAGSVYGFRVEPWLRTEAIEWGDLHFFARLDKDDKAHLYKGLDRVAKWLTKRGLDKWMPVDIEIRPARGKYAGTYTRHAKRRDYITLHPKDWSNARLLLAHESGHGIWHHQMTDKARARWIALFNRYRSVSTCPPETIRGLKDDFTKSGETVREFRSGLEEASAIMFDACCDHMERYHDVARRDIDTLSLAGDAETLLSMWPRYKVLTSEAEHPVTEYASTAPAEMFCESLALDCCGMQLPKRVKALLDSTLVQSGRA